LGGLPVRRSPHGRPGRLDDAARPKWAHTDQNTGESCPEGWHTDPSDEIHPFLAHYQTFNGAGVYFGFGLEGVTSADQRNAVMGRALDILLAP
jgi:hypothetical protein